MAETVPMQFSVAELWLMRSAVPHEIAQMDSWSYPPASRDLNDQIAEGLYLCSEQGQSDAWLRLSKGDCYVLDNVIDQTARDPDGNPIGINVLLKVIHARHILAASEFDDAVEPADLPSAAQVASRLKDDNDARSNDHADRDADHSTDA